MSITVRDIQEHTFATVIRGYDKDEVDDFLDEITIALEALIKENRSLKEAASHLPETQIFAAKVQAPVPEAQPASTPDFRAEESAYFKNLEITLRDTLLGAQRLADKTVTDAKTSSESIIANAHSEAATIKISSQNDFDNATTELNEVKKAIDDYRVRFKNLINDQVRVLKAETGLFE